MNQFDSSGFWVPTNQASNIIDDEVPLFVYNSKSSYSMSIQRSMLPINQHSILLIIL